MVKYYHPFFFDEAVTDFDINDITVTGGKKGYFTLFGSKGPNFRTNPLLKNRKGIISLTGRDAATLKLTSKKKLASNNKKF
ncbi:MAG: hypothetical protein H0A76_02160 [Candidatus Thiodubiliella endoseptemdiera]|uniref:Uncharacterized protein n=1 Tax=Candidatus Thiodubiliella endoseptemdiera TaxID=2738886 RepID=A0A853EYV9_9GAMM|nr:hypothetical protein [Candidatus Thiodubiliella endoseptemdiera]